MIDTIVDFWNCGSMLLRELRTRMRAGIRLPEVKLSGGSWFGYWEVSADLTTTFTFSGHKSLYSTSINVS